MTAEALRLAIDALHATAAASPEAEFAVHECFAALRAVGVDPRHSEDGKPRKTWVDRAPRAERQRGLF